MRGGWLVRGALLVVGRRLLAEARPRPDALRGRMRVDPDWRRVGEDGSAARLSPSQTIEVTRTRRWRRHQPLDVEPGWWPPSHAAGLGLWGAAVGLAWWVGRRHGRGPLRSLHEPWPAWSPTQAWGDLEDAATPTGD
jgi:hypothetical protein